VSSLLLASLPPPPQGRFSICIRDFHCLWNTFYLRKKGSLRIRSSPQRSFCSSVGYCRFLMRHLCPAGSPFIFSLRIGVFSFRVSSPTSWDRLTTIVQGTVRPLRDLAASEAVRCLSPTTSHQKPTQTLSLSLGPTPGLFFYFSSSCKFFFPVLFFPFVDGRGETSPTQFSSPKKDALRGGSFGFPYCIIPFCFLYI